MLYERKHNLCDAYGLGGSIAGAGLGIISGLINNKLAAEREKEARRENYFYGEMAADKADKRTRALYEDYQTYAAQMQQIKEAGLSPSILANGMSGAGGMTQGAQGSGAAGVSPTTYGLDPISGAQLGLMQAQARKTNAEADTLEGKNERGASEIAELQERINNVIAKTKNEGLKSAWYEYENALKSVEVGVQASISEEKVKNFVTECIITKHRARSAAAKADVDEATKDDVIKLVDEQVKNIIADTFLKRANKALTEAQKGLTDEQKKLVASQITLTDQQVQDLISQIETRSEQVSINRDTLNQNIREWAVKNGLWTDANTSYWEVVLKNLASEHTQDLIIDLLSALKK